MQSVPITTKVASSNPADGEVYSIKYYVIQLVSDMRFSAGIPVASTNKTDRHEITEIFLKVVLSNITLTTIKINIRI